MFNAIKFILLSIKRFFCLILDKILHTYLFFVNALRFILKVLAISSPVWGAVLGSFLTSRRNGIPFLKVIPMAIEKTRYPIIYSDFFTVYCVAMATSIFVYFVTKKALYRHSEKVAGVACDWYIAADDANIARRKAFDGIDKDAHAKDIDKAYRAKKHYSYDEDYENVIANESGYILCGRKRSEDDAIVDFMKSSNYFDIPKAFAFGRFDLRDLTILGKDANVVTKFKDAVFNSEDLEMVNLYHPDNA